MPYTRARSERCYAKSTAATRRIITIITNNDNFRSAVTIIISNNDPTYVGRVERMRRQSFLFSCRFVMRLINIITYRTAQCLPETFKRVFANRSRLFNYFVITCEMKKTDKNTETRYVLYLRTFVHIIYDNLFFF